MKKKNIQLRKSNKLNLFDKELEENPYNSINYNVTKCRMA